MILKVSHNKQDYIINTKDSIDISIPYKFNGVQPNFYDVNPGQLIPYKANGIVYSVDAGAGCNVSEISMNIHCTGTHTESVGHLLKNSGDIGIVLKDILFPSVLITIDPNTFVDTNESYHCLVNDDELVISKRLIHQEFIKWEKHQPQALIIRTNPNPDDKKGYQFINNPPAFFTNESLKYLI